MTKSPQALQRFYLSLTPLAVLVAAFVLSNTIWIFEDRHPWPWDQAWYGEVALDLWYARSGGIFPWYDAMVHAIASKPPLLVWLGQALLPLRRFGIEIETALLFLNIVAATVTLVIVGLLAERVTANRVASLVAVALCGSSALSVGLTHEFLVETLQSTIIAAIMLVAWHGATWSPIRVCSWTGILAAAALLTKLSSVLFVMPFLLYMFMAMWRARKSYLPTITDWAVFGCAIATISVTMIWYAFNLRQVLEHASTSTIDDAALLYGSAGSFFSKLRFWIGSLGTAITPFSVLSLAAGATIAFETAKAAAIRVSRSGREIMSIDATVFVFVIVTALVLVVWIYSLQLNEETRFLAPLIPLTSVLLAWSVRGRRILSGLFLMVFLFNGAVTHAYAFGWNFLHVTPTPWLKPLERSDRERALLVAIATKTCDQANRNRYVIVGVEYPALSANSVAFFSAKAQLSTHYRCQYTSLGYAEIDPQRAFNRIFAMNASYVVVQRLQAEASERPDAFNQTTRPVALLVAGDPRFVRIEELGEIAIFKKVEPLKPGVLGH